MADSRTLATPRTQQICLDPLCRTGRSADSGYGSLETSPTRSPWKCRPDRTSLALSARLESLSLSSYDGAGSEESDSEKSTHEEPETELLSSPSASRNQFATLPRVSRRRISRTDSYPVIPEPKAVHHRHGSDNTSVNGSRVSSLKALDRFVPMRDHGTPGSAKLRTSRPIEDLSSSEILVRHNQDAPDPFYFKRRALPPSPTESRKATRPTQGRTTLDPGSDNRPEGRVVSPPMFSNWHPRLPHCAEET